MHKILLLLVLLLITACAPYHYPAGTTPFERWQIDQARSDSWDRQFQSNQQMQPRRYCNKQYCW